MGRKKGTLFWGTDRRLRLENIAAVVVVYEGGDDRHTFFGDRLKGAMLCIQLRLQRINGAVRVEIPFECRRHN